MSENEYRQKADVSHLAKANDAILGELFGRDFIEKAQAGRLTLKDTLESNEVLADRLYGSEVGPLVKKGKFQSIIDYRDEVAHEIALDRDLMSHINFDEYGLIVVRPELYGEAERCRKLLEDAGFEVVVERDLTVNFNQYLSLYPHGLAISETYYDFPTRTVNYIDKVSKLVIFRKDANASDDREASTIVSEDLKGMQGVYREGTLRGELAFRALGPHLGSLDLRGNEAIALDPISAYRRLVAGDIASNGIHNSVTHPLMFYAAQGVHVPDRTEIARDLSLLCNQDDIERIIDIEHKSL